MQQQEKDLFKGYEIKHWDYSPYLYKVFAIAAVFNIVGLLALAQTNVLTTRGCESPFVGRVCQVIDTLYVGSTFLGNDSEFVSRDYVKTVIGDADITYIDVSSQTPPLVYPEGYFALANPNDFAAMNNMPADFMTLPPDSSGISNIPGIPSNSTIFNNPGADLMNTPQVVPTPNNNAVTGKIPTSPFSMGDNVVGVNPTLPNRTLPNRKFPRNTARNPLRNPIKSPSKLPKLSEDDVTAENKEPKPAEDKKEEIKNSDPVSEVVITKKPFEDLGDFVNEGLEKKEIDLNKPFKVVLDGVINADGKLDGKKSKFRDKEEEGDKKMIEIARQAIEAVGDSGFLAYLKNSGVDRVTFTLVQNDQQINAIIVSDQKTPEKAGTTASGFNAVLSTLKFADANNLKKLDDNSRALIENSKITSDGKNFVLNFALPKQAAQDIITKTLKDRAEKRAQQPKSSADTNSNSKTASAK